MYRHQQKFQKMCRVAVKRIEMNRIIKQTNDLKHYGKNIRTFVNTDKRLQDYVRLNTEQKRYAVSEEDYQKFKKQMEDAYNESWSIRGENEFTHVQDFRQTPYSSRLSHDDYHKRNIYSVYSTLNNKQNMRSIEVPNEVFRKMPTKQIYNKTAMEDHILDQRLQQQFNNKKLDIKPFTLGKPQSAFVTKMNNLKGLFRRFGVLGLSIHFTIYFSNILFFFIGLEIIPDEGREWILYQLDTHFDVESEKFKSRNSNLGLSWIMTKFTEPIRLLLTLYLTNKYQKEFNTFRSRNMRLFNQWLKNYKERMWTRKTLHASFGKRGGQRYTPLIKEALPNKVRHELHEKEREKLKKLYNIKDKNVPS